MNNCKGKTLTVMVCVVMVATVLAVAVQAGGNVIFDDQFDDSVLDPEWIVSPGRGDYSLTANPGYLRYIIDAYHTNRDGSSGYAKSLWLVRQFSGDQWTLATEITYNMRPGNPTNNRNMHFYIRTPGEGWVSMAYIGRTVGVCDSNPSSNRMSLYAGSDGMNIYFPGSTPGNCISPLPIDRWYFEIERNKDYVTIRASNDGDDSTFEYEREYTFTPGVLGNDQVIEIYGDGWYGSNSPPGYADFDFIRVTSTIIQATIDIDPDTLNLKSKGKFITCYIELPEDYSVEDIDIDSVALTKINDDLLDPHLYTVGPFKIGDYDDDDVPDLMVKFDRQELIPLLEVGDAELTISGELLDGPMFEETDTIRVIDKGKK